MDISSFSFSLQLMVCIKPIARKKNMFTLDIANFSSNLDSKSSKSDPIFNGDNLAFPVGGLES